MTVFGRVLCAALALVLCIGAFLTLPVTVLAEPVSPSWDYGNGTAGRVTLSAEELLREIFGEDFLTPGELRFFAERDETEFVFNAGIPDSIVASVYDAETGTLTLSVPAYEYTAANGKTVRWIPQTAILTDDATGEDTEKALSSSFGAWVCTFENLFRDSDFEVTVTFAWDASPDAAGINRLLAAPYAYGVAARDAEREYLAKKEAYEAALAAYDAYLQYQRDVAAYEAYLTAKASYDAASAAYAAYLEKVAEYEADYARYLTELAAYESAAEAYARACSEYETALSSYTEAVAAHAKWTEDVRAYYEYEEKKEEQLPLRQAYLSYLALREKADADLDLMECIYYRDSHGWNLYSSTMGEIVSSVLDRQEDLVHAGASRTDIENAGDATEVLRAVLTEYHELRQAEYDSGYEKKLALLGNYQKNYAALRDNFRTLYTSLSSLYNENPLVSSKIKAEGRSDHFRQFVALLYVIATGLDDEQTVAAGWEMNGFGLTDLLDERLQVTDTQHADPTGLTLPATEPEAVEELTPVADPGTEPAIPAKPQAPSPDSAPGEAPEAPIEPLPVESPGAAPAVVVRPAEVAEAAHPGQAPQAPSTTDLQKALVAEIADGTLTERTPLETDAKIRFFADATRRISVENHKTVTVYAMDGKTVLARETVPYGERMRECPVAEETVETPQQILTFAGWVLSDGTPISLGDPVTKDLSVYPDYRSAPRLYTVTWEVGEEKRTEQYRWGEMPTCPLPLVREADERNTYAFSGWDSDPVKVTADAVYRAIFVSAPRVYRVTWIYADGQKKQVADYPWGETPVFSGNPAVEPGVTVSSFRAWDREVVPVTADATYTALYDTVRLFSDADAQKGTVLHTPGGVEFCGENEKTLTLTLSDAAAFAYSAGKTLTVRCGDLSVTYDVTGTSALAGQAGGYALTVVSDRNQVSLEYADAAGKPIDGIRIPSTVTLSHGGTDAEENVWYLDGTPFAGRTTRVGGGAELTLKTFREILCPDGEPDEGLTLSQTAKTVTLRAEGEGTASLAVSGVFRYAKETGKNLTLSRCGAGLTFSAAALDALTAPGAGCVRVEFTADNAGLSVRYLADGSGTVTDSGFVADLTLPDAGADGVWYLGTEALTERFCTLRGGAVLTLKYFRPIRVTGAEHCNLLSFPKSAEEGTEVDLGAIRCASEYRIVSVSVCDENGNAIEQSGKTFRMPSCGVTVALTVEPAVYRVRFLVDGEVYREDEYLRGAEIVLPEPPVKTAEEGYLSTFTGWTPEVTRIADGKTYELTYTAVFRTTRDSTDPYKSEHNNNQLLTVFLPLALIGVSTVSVGTVCVILAFRKRKRP